MDCFDTDLDLTDADQISQVCLVLEHSYLGDLDIELISPSGQVIFLQTQGGFSANLGEPWATGTVDGVLIIQHLELVINIVLFQMIHFLH